MSGGLETIALAALQQLQALAQRNASKVSSSTIRHEEKQGDGDHGQGVLATPSMPDDDLTHIPSISNNTETSDAPPQDTLAPGKRTSGHPEDANGDHPAPLPPTSEDSLLKPAPLQQLVSSPASVSPTLSEDLEKVKIQGNASDAHNTRVVSLGSMVGCHSTDGGCSESESSSDRSSPSPAVIIRHTTTATTSPPQAKQGNVPPVVPMKTPSSLPELPPLTDFSVILENPEAWLQISEPYFYASLGNNNVDTTTVITDPQPFDVLCGRGGESNNARGNIQYRSLVKAYQKLYVDSTRRIKPKIAQCIVFSVRQAGGRFLKRVDGSDGTSKSDKKINTNANGSPTAANPGWIDVGNVKAREKTSQALRENAPDIRGTTGGIPGGTESNSKVQLSSVGAMNSASPKLQQQHPPAVSASSAFFHRHEQQQQSPSLMSSKVPPSNSSSSSSLNLSPLPKVGGGSVGALGSPSLMHHPLFSCLSPLQQQHILLMELQTAHHHSGLPAGYPAGQVVGESATWPPTTTKNGSASEISQLPHQQRPQHRKRPASSALGPFAVTESTGQNDATTTTTITTSNGNNNSQGCGPRLKRLKLRVQQEAGAGPDDVM